MEFVAIQLHARYHGPPGRSGLLSSAQFRMIDRDGNAYDVPIVLDVTPRLGRTLFPGGEHTGWAVFQVAQGDGESVLRFEPYFPDLEVRYLAVANHGGRARPDAGMQSRPTGFSASGDDPARPRSGGDPARNRRAPQT
jgi:hypothetical protein